MQHITDLYTSLGAAEITTGLDTTEEEGRDRPMQKAKMEIILTKSPQFDELMAASSSQQQSSSSSPGASGSNPPGGPGGLPGTGPSSQLQVGTSIQPEGNSRNRYCRLPLGVCFPSTSPSAWHRT